MRRNKHKYLFLIFLCFSWFIYSQKPTPIKVKKQNNIVYFYQKGNKTDTITKQKNNLFYFILNDSLKQSTRIFIDNGRFIATKNDSIIQFIFMPNLKYEAKFNIKDTLNKKHYHFVSLINGATNSTKNEITIKVISTKHDTPLIENTFYYRE